MIKDDSGNDDVVHSYHLVITLLLNKDSNKQQQILLIQSKWSHDNKGKQQQQHLHEKVTGDIWQFFTCSLWAQL